MSLNLEDSVYAIIETGGKQVHVEEGKKIFVEKLDASIGSEITIDTVLFAGGETCSIGTPYIQNARVIAEVIEQGRGDKVIVFKKKRRHGYRKKQGHRQYYTALKIKSITL